MAKEGASIPSELRETSDDDELMMSSICPRQTNSSIELSGQSLKYHMSFQSYFNVFYLIYFLGHGLVLLKLMYGQIYLNA
jgi:hypothetical protein